MGAALMLSLASASAFGYVEEIVPELLKFSSYRPTYFLVGAADFKIEVSFKIQGPSAFPLFLGYTQLMMWNFYQTSGPFRDINYNPDLFYRITLPGAADAKAPGHWLDLGIIEHESNGRAGADTRSWDRTYARFSKTSALGEGSAQIHWNLKAWVPYGFDSTNTDIADYRGLGEINVSLVDLWRGLWETSGLTLRFYPAGGGAHLDPLRGGQELTFKARFRSFGPRILWTAQYFHGYGENLIDFRERRSYLRGGISF